MSEAHGASAHVIFLHALAELWEESVVLIWVLDFTEALALDWRRKRPEARRCRDERPRAARARSVGSGCASILCPASSWLSVVIADMLLGD